MSGRTTSDIWYHFEKVQNRGKCRYCQVFISIASGSTTNLKRHLRSKHPTISLHREEQPQSHSPSVDDPKETCHSNTSTSISSTYTCISSIGQGETNTTMSPPLSVSPIMSKKFQLGQPSMSKFVDVIRPISVSKKRSLDTQLLKVICKEYHPFSIVEDEELKKFVNMLNPNYKLPSRKTLTNSLLPMVFNNILEKVKAAVNEAEAICVTCDGWTNINNVGYYALTAHYINKKTQMQSCLLECSEFLDTHTSANIAVWINEVLNKFAVCNKVCAVVTDNAANIKAAVTELNLRHLSCFAHTLNLVVKNAIFTSINDVVIKVKGLVQYFKKSNKALVKLNEMQISLNKEQLKLKQDVPTRWNSTYDMLERVVKNKEPIVSTLALLGTTEVSNFEQDDWDVMNHAVKLLEVFNDVTKELSAESNVTLSKTTILSRLMARKVKVYIDNNPCVPEKITCLSNILLDGLSKRFGQRESNDLIKQSILLDPRFKRQGFGDDEKFKTAYHSLIGRVKLAAKNNESTMSSQITVAVPQTCSSSSVWDEFDTVISNLNAKQEPTSGAIVEVDKYLNEPYLPRTGDPLQWWETRKHIYPNIYSIVLKRLCIPATSVPCERIFSKAGQICTEKRSKLTTDKISKILFINCNLNLF